MHKARPYLFLELAVMNPFRFFPNGLYRVSPGMVRRAGIDTSKLLKQYHLVAVGNDRRPASQVPESLAAGFPEIGQGPEYASGT